MIRRKYAIIRPITNELERNIKFFNEDITTCLDTYSNTNLYVSATVFITQGNYIGYMFRVLNSHLQAYSLQVKSQDAVHTLRSQCVYIGEIFKPYHLPSRVKLANYVTNWLKYI